MKPSSIASFLGGLSLLAVTALAQSTTSPSSPPSSAQSSTTQSGSAASPDGQIVHGLGATPPAKQSGTTTSSSMTPQPSTAAQPAETETTTTKTTTTNASSVSNPNGSVTNSTTVTTDPVQPGVDADLVAADAARFSSLDSDGDTNISRSEFTLGSLRQLQGDNNVVEAARLDQRTAAARNASVNTIEAFNQLDLNKDGQLSAAELAAQNKTRVLVK